MATIMLQHPSTFLLAPKRVTPQLIKDSASKGERANEKIRISNMIEDQRDLGQSLSTIRFQFSVSQHFIILLVHIVPKRTNNRVILHAYPVRDPVQMPKYAYDGIEYSSKYRDIPPYAKKLEYSDEKNPELKQFKSSEKKKRKNKENR